MLPKMGQNDLHQSQVLNLPEISDLMGVLPEEDHDDDASFTLDDLLGINYEEKLGRKKPTCTNHNSADTFLLDGARQTKYQNNLASCPTLGFDDLTEGFSSIKKKLHVQPRERGRARTKSCSTAAVEKQKNMANMTSAFQEPPKTRSLNGSRFFSYSSTSETKYQNNNASCPMLGFDDLTLGSSSIKKKLQLREHRAPNRTKSCAATVEKQKSMANTTPAFQEPSRTRSLNGSRFFSYSNSFSRIHFSSDDEERKKASHGNSIRVQVDFGSEYSSTAHVAALGKKLEKREEQKVTYNSSVLEEMKKGNKAVKREERHIMRSSQIMSKNDLASAENTGAKIQRFDTRGSWSTRKKNPTSEENRSSPQEQSCRRKRSIRGIRSASLRDVSKGESKKLAHAPDERHTMRNNQSYSSRDVVNDDKKKSSKKHDKRGDMRASRSKSTKDVTAADDIPFLSRRAPCERQAYFRKHMSSRELGGSFRNHLSSQELWLSAAELGASKDGNEDDMRSPPPKSRYMRRPWRAPSEPKPPKRTSSVQLNKKQSREEVDDYFVQAFKRSLSRRFT
jgi:hypothetical protein